MATLSLNFPSIILLSFSYVVLIIESTAGSATATANPDASFIRTSCRATTYPSVCVQSLSTYASTVGKNPKQLVITALSVSLDRAHSTRSFMRKLSKFRGLKQTEYAAIKDCLEVASDGVDRLSESVRQLKRLGRPRGAEFIRHMSNLQTWVSAALTDDSTCVDGFSGRAMNGRIKSSVRARMSDVAQVTSNALALCNQFAGNQ